MANNKIVDRESLKAFRQANDTRYQNGSVVVGKSLTTKQIENINEEVGSTQTAPFLFQATGTDNNTTETPTAPVAKHLELRGNTVHWNQLAQLTTTKNFSGTNSFDSTNNTLTLNGSWTSSGNKRLSADSVGIIANHTYCRKVKVSGTISEDLIIEFAYLGALKLTIPAGTYSNEIFELIATPTEGNTTNIAFGQVTTTNVLTNFTIQVQLFDLTLLGKEYDSVLAFNRDYPLPYYEYNARELKSCKSSKLITVGYNQCDGVYEGNLYSSTTGLPTKSTHAFRGVNRIRVIPGQTYRASVGNIGSSTAGPEIYEYDANDNFIRKQEANSTTRVEGHLYEYTLTNRTAYIRWSVWSNNTNWATNVPSVETAQVCIYLAWDGSRKGFEPYVKHEYALPSVELRSVGNVYDEITSDGVYTQRIGVRDYESGDESDTSVITDLTHTYYVLETPVVSEVSSFAENIIVDDFGIMEFVPSIDNVEPIVPQGNKFFYPADYVLFIDDLYNRSKDDGEDADVNNFVVQSELQQAVGNIDLSNYAKKEEAFNVINANDIVNNTLTQAQFDLITNGKPTRIVGTFRNLTNPILHSGFASSSYYFGQIQGYYNGEYQYLIYYINLSTKLVEIDNSKIAFSLSGNQVILNRLQSVNGKQIPNYPSSTGTFVLKCVNGTLTWVEE